MKRRGFLALLGLLPLAPIIVKTGLEESALVKAGTKLPDGTLEWDGRDLTVDEDGWHHFAVTRKGDVFQGYVDGVRSDNSPLLHNQMEILLKEKETLLPGKGHLIDSYTFSPRSS